jgi:hypothetical protein
MVEVEITGATGTGPYNIYLCDPYFSYCELISGSTIIPPTITFVLEGVFLGLTSFIIKLVDSNGCEIFHPYSCPVTPTPTPTNTPTPTPTPTPGCHCIIFVNLEDVTKNISFIKCNGEIFYGTIDSSNVLYFCGSNPVSDKGVSKTIGGVCVGGSCI